MNEIKFFLKKMFRLWFIVVFMSCNDNESTRMELTKAHQQIDSLNNALMTCQKELEVTHEYANFNLEKYQQLKYECDQK